MARRDARAQTRGARRNVDGRRREKWREIRGRRRRGTARAIVRDGPNFVVDCGAIQLSVLLLVPREDQTNPTWNVEGLLERLEGV